MSTCHSCGAWVFGCFLLATCKACVAKGHDASRGGPWSDKVFLKKGKTPKCELCDVEKSKSDVCSFCGYAHSDGAAPEGCTKERFCQADGDIGTDKKCGLPLPCKYHKGPCVCGAPMHYGGVPGKDCGMPWPG